LPFPLPFFSFTLGTVTKILSKLSFILSGYERIKLFLIALDLFPKIDDKIEDFVLEIAKRLKIELWYSKEKNAIKIDTKANLNKYLEIRQAFEKNKNRPKAEFVPSYVFRIIPIPINKKISNVSITTGKIGGCQKLQNLV
jgi:hypothetical protein